jgi:hypothetical protein
MGSQKQRRAVAGRAKRPVADVDRPLTALHARRGGELCPDELESVETRRAAHVLSSVVSRRGGSARTAQQRPMGERREIAGGWTNAVGPGAIAVANRETQLLSAVRVGSARAGSVTCNTRNRHTSRGVCAPRENSGSSSSRRTPWCASVRECLVTTIGTRFGVVANKHKVIVQMRTDEYAPRVAHYLFNLVKPDPAKRPSLRKQAAAGALHGKGRHASVGECSGMSLDTRATVH